VQIQDCIARWQAGDRSAANALVLATGRRLERLARKMLRGFPNVRRWSDTADVVQAATVRLLRSLLTMMPVSGHDFFNLAAVHVRRELLDLARQYAARNRLEPPQEGRKAARALQETKVDLVVDPAPKYDELEIWCQFHVAVERLPAVERQIVGLAFYQGLTHAQIAELLQVTERTVRRHWQTACTRLRIANGADLPWW
jgi:RNA polymerase sigma-70 factor (ECF subfamily)